MRAAAAPSHPAWQAALGGGSAAALGLPVFAAQRRRPRRDEAARVMPQAMLFVRGGNAGISHNPLESITATTPSCACAPSSTCSSNSAAEKAPMTGAPLRPDPLRRRLDAWIDAHFDEEVRFLQELVQVPTDTPPGNNAPHAERTAELLAGFGYDAEKHPVPAAEVQATACSRSPT
jgi:hypothetical protein